MTNILIGKVLNGVKIASDREAIMFQTPEGDIVARCDADCCSYTWIEHVELPARGFGSVVISAEELDMPDLGDMAGRDVMQYYGFKIVTDRGELIIDFRNESNGYYGGWLSFPGDGYYGGVYGQNVSVEDWKEISE